MTKRGVLHFRKLHRNILEHNVDQHTRSLCLYTFVYNNFDLGRERFQHFWEKKYFINIFECVRETLKISWINNLSYHIATGKYFKHTKLKLLVSHPKCLQGFVHCALPCEKIGHIPTTRNIYTGLCIVIHIHTEWFCTYKLVDSLWICSTHSGLPFAGIHDFLTILDI